MGWDRLGRTYWVFYFVTFLLVEPSSGESDWETIVDTQLLRRTIECLDERGQKEFRLKESLSEEFDGIKTIMKEREDHQDIEAPNLRRKSKPFLIFIAVKFLTAKNKICK